MPLYDGPIIDAHHHLWALSMDCHPWLIPRPAEPGSERGSLGDLAPIRRDYLPDDFRRDAAGQGIVASVHVEAGWRADDTLGETEWLLGLDRRHGVAARLVAAVALGSPDAERRIEDQARHPEVTGIRDVLSWDDDPARRFATRGDLMGDPGWRRGLARLRDHDLVFDLMIFPAQLEEAARLAADFPDQLFVLNHAGSPIDRDEAGLRRWRGGLAELARFENVAVKLSDLVAYDHGWTLDSLRPVVQHCLDCFGPSRAMVGSDFPVAGLHARFAEIFDAFRALTAELSADEQRAVFHDTAQRIYRI